MADGVRSAPTSHRPRPARWPVVVAVAWTAFAVLAGVLAANGWAPFAFERAAVDWCAAHRPPVARSAALAVTSLGAGPVPYLLAFAAGLVALRSTTAPRSRRTGARLLLVPVLLAPLLWLVAGELVRRGLMHAFARPRPPGVDRAVAASDFAFPSGHAFTSAVCAGLLALAVARAYPRAARAATAGALLFTGAIGLSRVYLGVHWPLDVLGGWLLAAGWLAAGTAVLRPWSRRA
ncbi:phosphatase PAP2 family protein [Kitasatospora misakiensis]|uniref:Phosphatase PAP2 family protein n=1 Tax=Kitasatospora misakiensis TaxID=67330 RepID=A0ABW0X3B8_9ACTN